MAYSEELAERIRDVLAPRAGVRERKMFGGVAWMINGNMSCGVIDDGLLVRVEREEVEAALAEEHVGRMDFTGRPMNGFVVVAAAGIADDAELARWIETGAGFAESLPPK